MRGSRTSTRSSATSPRCRSRCAPRRRRACTVWRGAGDPRVREYPAGDGGARRDGARRRGGVRPRARGSPGTGDGAGDRRRGPAGGSRGSGGGGGRDPAGGGERPPRAAAPRQGGVAALAQGGAARASRRLSAARDAARARPRPGGAPPGRDAGGARAGARRAAGAEPRGVSDPLRGHPVGDADGGGARAHRLRVRARCRGGRGALRGGALLAAAAPSGAHPRAGDRGVAAGLAARRSGDGDEGAADRVRDPDPASRRVAGAGACGGRRIGHGTRLAEDAALFDAVVERRIPLEVCLTSNLHTRAVPAIGAHPFPRYLERGAVATLNTDGRLVDGVSLTDEYFLAHAAFGLGREALARVVLNACESAFLPEPEKVALVARVQSELEALQ